MGAVLLQPFDSPGRESFVNVVFSEQVFARLGPSVTQDTLNEPQLVLPASTLLTVGKNDHLPRPITHPLPLNDRETQPSQK